MRAMTGLAGEWNGSIWNGVAAAIRGTFALGKRLVSGGARKIFRIWRCMGGFDDRHVYNVRKNPRDSPHCQTHGRQSRTFSTKMRRNVEKSTKISEKSCNVAYNSDFQPIVYPHSPLFWWKIRFDGLYLYKEPVGSGSLSVLVGKSVFFPRRVGSFLRYASFIFRCCYAKRLFVFSKRRACEWKCFWRSRN